MWNTGFWMFFSVNMVQVQMNRVGLDRSESDFTSYQTWGPVGSAVSRIKQFWTFCLNLLSQMLAVDIHTLFTTKHAQAVFILVQVTKGELRQKYIIRYTICSTDIGLDASVHGRMRLASPALWSQVVFRTAACVRHSICFHTTCFYNLPIYFWSKSVNYIVIY